MQRELTYNKWVKYIHDYQLNKYKVKYTQKPAEKSGAMLLDELREQEDIMTDNQIIAEFMGIESINAKMRGHLYECPVTAEYVTELEYHTSWDWLMPVMAKIVHEFGDGWIFEEGYNLDKRYQAVVKFINEYNKRK